MAIELSETIAGYNLLKKIDARSGEADLFIAEKDNDVAVIKVYRTKLKAKTEILDALQSIDTSNIVQIKEFGYYNERFYEIMEYASGGALNDKNQDGSYRYLPLSEEKALDLCREIINGYKACHDAGIIHRDIKPGNIYLRNANGSEFIIGDFGISSIMQEDEVLHQTQSMSRTTGYAAPEVLSGLISTKMDYYALGITLWEVLSAKDPFTLENGQPRNAAHLLRDTIEGRIADDLLSREPLLSDRMQHLIRGLLVVDEAKRWGYDEATRFLNGEEVSVYVAPKKIRPLTFAGNRYQTLDDYGRAIMANPEEAKRDLIYGAIEGQIEEYDSKLALEIASLARDLKAYDEAEQLKRIQQIGWLLAPSVPLQLDDGTAISSIEGLLDVIRNKPECIGDMVADKYSLLYTWMEIAGYREYACEMYTKCLGGVQNPDMAQKADILLKAQVIFNDYTIKPFAGCGLKDYELSSKEQLASLSQEQKEFILELYRSGSSEGLFNTWLELVSDGKPIDAETWQAFEQSLE